MAPERPPYHRRLIRHLDAALAFAAALLLCLLLLCVSLGVVTRALGDPLIWTDEVARFLMIWLAVLGWLLASRKRVHIRIRFFVDRLPAILRPTVERVLLLAVALFGALTAWYGYDLGWWSDAEKEAGMLALQGRHYETGKKMERERVAAPGRDSKT